MTRTRALLIGAIALTVALVGGGLIWFQYGGDQASRRPVVTASSSAEGFAPDGLMSQESGSRGWRSRRQTVGAWVDLSWKQPQDLDSLSFTVSDAGSAVTAGMLQFRDGSSLQVALNGEGARSVIDFTSRKVRGVKFTVTGVSSGPSFVGLASLSLNDSPAKVASEEGGDAAPVAKVTATRGGDPRALARGASWTTTNSGGTSLTYRWKQPRELVAIEFAGASTGSTLSRAVLRFGGGGQVEIGAVRGDPRLPTKVAFMPRVVRSVMVTIEATAGAGPLTLSALHLWERGSTPPTAAVLDGGVSVSSQAANSCQTVPAVGSTRAIQVLCPTNGTTVGSSPDLVVVAPSGAVGVRAEAWPASGSATVAPVDVSGSGTLRVPLRLGGLPQGPVTVRFTALGLPAGDIAPVEFQLLHGGGSDDRVATSARARGRTLVWDEEFSDPVSVSREDTDSRYAAAKPETSGYADFGEASFADPSAGLENIGTLARRYLRLSIEPVPDGHAGGMLASAHPGGSGFSAQYGYFETRMLVPANPGTWPAFWMLPSANLISSREPVAEIDAIELYGHDPIGACHTSHSYVGGKDSGGEVLCGQRFESVRRAAQWHTYGVAVDATAIRYFIDGRQVAHSRQVPGGGDPMFFLVDLALGGGWPVQLAGTQQRSQMLVDWIRVYV